MVVVVKIAASEVKITILRVRSVLEKRRLLLSGRCLEALSEWNGVVPVPASKRRRVSPPAVLSSTVFLVEEKTVNLCTYIKEEE